MILPAVISILQHQLESFIFYLERSFPEISLILKPQESCEHILFIKKLNTPVLHVVFDYRRLTKLLRTLKNALIKQRVKTRKGCEKRESICVSRRTQPM